MIDHLELVSTSIHRDSSEGMAQVGITIVVPC